MLLEGNHHRDQQGRPQRRIAGLFQGRRVRIGLAQPQAVLQHTTELRAALAGDGDKTPGPQPGVIGGPQGSPENLLQLGARRRRRGQPGSGIAGLQKTQYVIHGGDCR